MNIVGQRLASVGIAVATALVIVGAAIIPFLTREWVAFEQDRAQAQAWTGYATADLRLATNAILDDLIWGPPDFDVEVAGAPVLEERERGHMRDVRSVFGAFAALVVVGGVVLAVAAWRMDDRHRLWQAVRAGATWLAIGVVGLGLFSLVAFDTLFSTFHVLLFPAGSYTFDPRTDRMVQLFPFQFWEESAMAVGVVIVAIAVIVGVVARRRETRGPAVAGAAQTDVAVAAG